MMKLEAPNWDEICGIIEQEDVYSPDEDHGIENNPHITVLYGFYSFVSTEAVAEILKQFGPPRIRFKDVGIFQDHPDFDVVMIAVESEDLAKMNLALDFLPNEKTFPSYKPHATIAYVKKGTAKKYEGMHLDFPEELTLTDVIYSMPDGEKKAIQLHER